ncbi:hypothetical protein SUGI_0693430 [Cryptomeria japonica]|uniref:putative UPF0481 protein At3g02645 n=1 Tax=Cryptomeria japonica TaxID=3369 RepID=UPI002414AF21|nr:putative UPF0481 protein At3g02645 [Cryptomeria japonica]GLJ34476.1 hypothetical protein SUGI_0693430 [Cryptomeria japonica]
MAQQDNPTCGSHEDKGVLISQVNGGDRTQCNEAWLIKVDSTLNVPEKMWRVSKNVCIYRVPQAIKISKPEDYEPTVVSLWPYHHNINPQFSKMDQHKLQAVHRVSTRLKIDVPTLIAEFEKLELEIRECYEEPIELNGKSLSRMLAMDACFILEICRNSAVSRSASNSDFFSLISQRDDLKNSMFYAILDDLIKLENQIPLFVILKLLELEEGGTREYAATELATMLSKRSLFRGNPFFKFSQQDAIPKLKEHMMGERPAYHLLDLCRKVVKDKLTNSTGKPATCVENDGYRGANNISNDNGWSMNAVLPGWVQRVSCIDILPRVSPLLSPDDRRATPSTELLYGAGIRFQPGKIKFEKRRFGSRTLYLPSVTITDNTESRLRNLMAYEECQRCSWYPEPTVVSHFVILFDYLIDSEKDVALLRKSRIIGRMVGCDENIARMFNRIRVGITFSGIGQIEEVTVKARNHYKSQWKVWMSQFKEEHFSKPWYILSLVAAILILGMTAIQTVYSVD